MTDEKSPDIYYTINKPNVVEISVKGSRFIAFLNHADSADAAERYLHEIRKKYHDATHHCFAYVTGTGPERHERFSDDGEPSGSAGRPIMNAVTAGNITDVICVVVRYFGGTKLGVGGLGRAYGDSARAVIENTPTVKKVIRSEIVLQFPYDLTGTIERYVGDSPAVIIGRNFGESPSLTCGVPKSRVDSFITQLRDLTRDRITILNE